MAFAALPSHLANKLWVTIPVIKLQPPYTKVAISLPELIRDTNAFSVKRRAGCEPTLTKSRPKELFLEYKVVCHENYSDPRGHDVQVQFDLSQVEKTQDAKRLDVRCNCSCPAFLYWGAQWNVNQRDGLLGEARPLLQAPTERLDLRGNFVICKHCLASGSMVLMADGTEKSIEKVKVGDWVITHKGRPRQVIAVSKRCSRPGEEAVSTSVKGCSEPLVTSIDHGFAAVRGNEVCFCGCGGKLPYDYKGVKWDRKYLQGHGGHHGDDPSVEDCSRGRLVWPEAGQLAQFDYLYFPKIEREGATEVRPELASLLGYYLAEGSLIKHKVGTRYERTGKRAAVRELEDGRYNLYGVAFTLNLDEQGTLASDIVEKVKILLGPAVDVSLRPRKSKGKKWLQVIVNEPEFAALMLRLGGNGSNKKQFSAEAWGWNLSAIEEVLSSYALGDGHLDETGQQCVYSISPNLISQVSTILFSLGIWHGHIYQDWQGKKSIGKRKNNRYHRLYWDFRRYPQVLDRMIGRLRPHVLAAVKAAGRCSQEGDYWGDGFLRCLHRIERVPAPPCFHDISVDEDESFIANRIAVHNCKAVFERILPAVQNNIQTIVRKREVELNKKRLEEAPKTEKEKKLQKRQEEMRKKKEIEKIVRVKDPEKQKRLIDELLSEEGEPGEVSALPPLAAPPKPKAPAPPAAPTPLPPAPKKKTVKRDEKATEPLAPKPAPTPQQPSMDDLIRQEEVKLQRNKQREPRKQVWNGKEWVWLTEDAIEKLHRKRTSLEKDFLDLTAANLNWGDIAPPRSKRFGPEKIWDGEQWIVPTDDMKFVVEEGGSGGRILTDPMTYQECSDWLAQHPEAGIVNGNFLNRAIVKATPENSSWEPDLTYSDQELMKGMHIK